MINSEQEGVFLVVDINIVEIFEMFEIVDVMIIKLQCNVCVKFIYIYICECGYGELCWEMCWV